MKPNSSRKKLTRSGAQAAISRIQISIGRGDLVAVYGTGVSVALTDGRILNVGTAFGDGSRLRDRINDGIGRARYFIVALTPESVTASWVRHELDAAMLRELDEKRIVVIPLLYGDVSATDVPSTELPTTSFPTSRHFSGKTGDVVDPR